MSKSIRFFFILVLFLSVLSSVYAQWGCVLSTVDDRPNGTGNQTPSVSPINENMFVAVGTSVPSIPWRAGTYDDVNAIDTCSMNYLVAYKNATDTTGRLGTYGYGSELLGLYSTWFHGFADVKLNRAYKIVCTPDSLIYVANNDLEHSVLVFKVANDTVESTEYRLATGTNEIMGLAVDNAGYVYVLNTFGTTANTKEIKVFRPIKDPLSKWHDDLHTDDPVSTVDLATGVYRGLAVSADGKNLYVSSMSARNVVKYWGSPLTGYIKDTHFTFAMTSKDTIIGSYYDTLGTQAWDLAKPLGMAYMNGNNLLFIASARWLGYRIRTHNNTSGYSYSKIFVVNAYTGAAVDTIDIAKYYYKYTNSYSSQRWDTVHISGYSSSYDVQLDSRKTLYTQSMYSWTAEKWTYKGTLPVIAGVEKISNDVPSGYGLEQNYPNPFNPTTTIRFSVPHAVHVKLTITNMLGQQIASLVDEKVDAGSHQVQFDARRFSSGVYFYTITTGDVVMTKKMIFTK
jgi:hypothetical protein